VGDTLQVGVSVKVPLAVMEAVGVAVSVGELLKVAVML
jgi:hypothetical protein